VWHIESTRLSLWDQLACFYSLRTINHGGYNLDIHGGQLARLDVKPFNLQAATHFGRLRAELYRIGKPIAPYDMRLRLMQAHWAWSWRQTTPRNLRAPGLRIIDWV
jgi:tRNA(fMet)-specific endonuclease VapC